MVYYTSKNLNTEVHIIGHIVKVCYECLQDIVKRPFAT